MEMFDSLAEGFRRTSQGVSIMAQHAQTRGLSATGARSLAQGTAPASGIDRLRCLNDASNASAAGESFVGDLLGLDGVASKTRGVIKKTQQKVESGIDWAVDRARALLD